MNFAAGLLVLSENYHQLRLTWREKIIHLGDGAVSSGLRWGRVT